VFTRFVPGGRWDTPPLPATDAEPVRTMAQWAQGRGSVPTADAIEVRCRYTACRCTGDMSLIWLWQVNRKRTESGVIYCK